MAKGTAGALIAFAVRTGLLAGTALGPDDVDVFIGTAELGHVTPAAMAPFGLVQAGPDTSEKADEFLPNWRHCGGYQHGDAFVWRFSQTHLNGVGCSALGDIAIMPCVGTFDAVVRPASKVVGTEVGSPGFYGLTVEEDGRPIRCEVAALAHSAVYRFAVPEKEGVRLLLDLDWGFCWADGDPCFRKQVRSSSCEFPQGPITSVRGGRSVWTWNDYRFFFAMTFSSPARSSRRRRIRDGVRGDIWELDFGTPPGGTLEVRVGLSSVSSAAAWGNLRFETDGLDFAGIRARGVADWVRHLGRVSLGDGTPKEVRTNFASALYRTMVQPNNLGDVGERAVYSTFSLWDTFRAAHPLYTLLVPERVPDFVTSLLDQCDRQGYLPIWSLGGSENHCMIGHHAVPVVVDACLKGLVPSNQFERAYLAVRQSLTVNHKAINDGTWGLVKEDWDVLDRYGYYPFDKLSGGYNGRPVLGESVSRTLECAYDDACAARFASALGRADDAAFFRKRSGNWRNLYDASTGFMRGRDSQGRWREPFSPYAIGLGPWLDNDFCEGNSHQYTWHVLHDPAGLVGLMGGGKRCGERLDELFSARATDHAIDGEDTNCTGCIGQYAHGNEPSHHIAYLYAYTDRPWRTAEVVRKVCETQYAVRPDGLCGNDDCGQMAAWYVFSSLGFYPLDPCGGDYVLGAPQLPEAVVEVGGGRRFAIVAKGLSDENRYVRSVTLNGRRIDGFVIRHSDVVKGGELVFEMSNERK